MEHWWNDTDRENTKYSEKSPVPVLLCPTQNSHGLTWDLSRALEMIDLRFIFYGDNVNFRHQSSTTAKTFSGMILRKTWGSQNGVNEHTILLGCYALSTAKWLIKLWSKLLRCLWLLSLPPFSALLWTWFLQYCLKFYGIEVQALVSLSLSKFVKTSHIEHKIPRILNGVQYHNACTEFHENPSVASPA